MSFNSNALLPGADDLAELFGVAPEKWEQVKQESRLARVAAAIVDKGRLYLPAAMALAQPLGFAVAFVLTFAGHAFGQGPIIGPNPSNLGQLLVKAIKIFYQAIFVVGIIGVGLFVIGIVKSDGQGIPWMRLVGSLLCFAVGLVASVVYNFARGNTVDIDLTELGGN